MVLSSGMAQESIRKKNKRDYKKTRKLVSIMGHFSHWINSYTAWMDELRPWCISRQLWWGHRIPVFTCRYM